MNNPSTRREVRTAVYYRLHWLWPILARPAVGRGLRLFGWSLFGLWLAFVVLVLALRYVVLPRVGDYQAEIEQAVSQAVGQPVRIGHIEARWQGLNPDLVLGEVQISDHLGVPAFTLRRVESVLSWQSLWRLHPRLALLVFDGPVLHVRRETDGRISIAGMATGDGSDPAFARWVLEQRQIRVRNATIVWDDKLRAAPPLVLEDLQFGLDNRGRRHRFGLSALPPPALASRIEMRGEVKGDIGEVLANFTGKVFVELDYADLAGWRQWIDYPIHLPQGHGALRLWGDLQDGTSKLVSDFALEDVRIRLGQNLPELELASMRGRLEGTYATQHWSVLGRRVELLTRDGIRVVPTDFQADWREDPETAVISGAASATFLDLGILSKLAAYVPLDTRSRSLLQKHQPLGQITELRASWGLKGETLQTYALRAGFAGLGLEAGGYFPGARGLGGQLDLTEKGGELTLDSAKSSLSLPAVFPEPEIALDSLQAKVSWRVDQATDIRLERLAFAGPDAAGSAQGSYRYTGQGPGEIDLQAKVDRADGKAVWRYMPHAVNADARAWLRRGIVSGRGYDGKLVLQGNLKDFPFRDGKGGKFLVTAKAADTRIDYAPGWPVIDGVDGEMSFGTGMKVTASKGTILGAKLGGVTVEIPDFESHEEMLLVRGTAQGPTTEFLHFIDQSPVAEKIDHFTDDMKAVGEGRLDLELDIPLRHALDTHLRGIYHFQNNQLQPVPELPPLAQVNGRLQLTENSIVAQDISGRLFGGPLKLQVSSLADKVSVRATGNANIAEVSRHFAFPLMDQLSGKAAWKTDISIRKRNADVTIDSDLLGISSPLPAPFNKNATSPLALHIERTAPEANSEQWRVSLGKAAQGLFVRRQGRLERGVLAIGQGDLRLPDKGLAVRVALPEIDADAWRNYFPDDAGAGPGAGTGTGKENGSAGMALNFVSLKTPRLHLLGRDFSQLDSTLRARDDGWQISLDTREAAGDIFWRSTGEGWVEGDFKRLIIKPAAEAEAEVGAGTTQLLNSLPGMSLVVDDFQMGDKALGKLELKARNDKGAWHLDQLSLKNPAGSLKGKATWNNVGRHQTNLNFELDARDLGKLLDRLGYADTVRRGTAKLTGNLQWDGPLTRIDYPSLTGQVSMSAEKGQFNKLQPGVGKLLGLISLQSLPRRLTLDFRDIFSDGLAFDSIQSTLAVKKGVMRTVEPLRIRGPAAEIEMQGETDLKDETQDLQVLVRPEIGNAAVVGVALVNPVVGAAALLANTVLPNPLNRLFSYHYHVTGSWSDPLVDKVGDAAPESKVRPAGGNKP